MALFDFIEDVVLRAKAEEAHVTFAAEQEKKLGETVAKSINEAVAGLKSKNEELLNEKKSITEKLKQFQELGDPVKAMEALKFIQDNEDAQLLQQGKVDELITKRTSDVRAKYESTIKELTEKLHATDKEAITYKTQFETKIIEDTLRNVAIKAGVRPEALYDVLLRGRMLFTLGKDGSVEARDSKGALLKTDKDLVLTPDIWMGELKDNAPHYWLASQGVGATGFTGTGTEITEKMAAAAKSGDMKSYRKLRKQSQS